MKHMLLTATVCMLWAPVFAFAQQSSDQDQHSQQQKMSQALSDCKQAQQALSDASTMLQNASSTGASQAALDRISKTVDQAKTKLNSCTSNLESIQQSEGGGSMQGGGGSDGQ